MQEWAGADVMRVTAADAPSWVTTRQYSVSPVRDRRLWLAGTAEAKGCLQNHFKNQTITKKKEKKKTSCECIFVLTL